MKNKQKIIKKILKCLSLASSSNEHEAAIALGQAQKLMTKYGISELDVDIATVTESSVTTCRTSRPPVWMRRLAELVSKAFGVDYFHYGKQGTNRYTFVGIGAAPEIAGYSFTVLRRQLTKARENWIKQRYGKRGRVSMRTRKGDLFAIAWVSSIEKMVTEFAMSVKTKKKIDKYLKVHYPELTMHVNKIIDVKSGDGEALLAGFSSAKGVRLYHGMNGKQQQLLSEA